MEKYNNESFLIYVRMKEKRQKKKNIELAAERLAEIFIAQIEAEKEKNNKEKDDRSDTPTLSTRQHA